MKKAVRTTALLLAASIFLGSHASLSAFADSPSDGFDIRSGVLVKYSGTAANVTVPDGVTAIGDEAFLQDSSLTSIALPDGVASIGSQAFEGCSSLSSVTFGNGLKTVGNYAFYNCRALTGIALPTGLATIDSGAFQHTALTSVAIPEGVAKLGDGAFSDCAALAAVTFPSTLMDFGRELFDRTPWLQEYPEDSVVVNGVLIAYQGSGGSITLPTTVKKISPYVLSGNLSLTHVTLPEGVTEIGAHAFEYDSNLTGVSLPESLTRIGEFAFQESGLTGITLPGHLTELDSSAFTQCASLKTASVPGSLKQIGDHAFFWCRALSSVTLAAGVESIGDEAFDGCTALQAIALPAGLKTIGEDAFLACTGLAGISLPNSVVSLGQGAFMLCTSLSSLTLSSGLTALGPDVFRECYSLKTLSIPSGVKTVGAYSFLDGALTSVTIPASVEFIDADAFNSATGRQQESVPKLYGYSGTEAQRFAAKYGYAFVPLGSVLEPFRLDTTGTYDFGSRNTYLYLAKTVSSIAPKATSSNPKIISVSFVQKVSDGYLFRISRLAQGTAVITTTLGSESALFTAKSGPSVRCDTTAPFSLKKGNSYLFKVTVLSASSSAPRFTVGNGSVLQTQYAGKNGKDYFFRIRAVGKSGEATGVYTAIPGESAVRQCIVKIA